MIADDTALLPGIVADGVCQEAALMVDSDLPLEYSDRLATYADAVYDGSREFHKMMNGKGDRPRDMLYAFMRHWLAGFLKAEHRTLFDKLPQGFSNGEEPHPILRSRAYQAAIAKAAIDTTPPPYLGPMIVYGDADAEDGDAPPYNGPRIVGR